jgi:hypothetical protein
MSRALMAARRGRRNVVLLRLRRPIREKPNIRLPFAALVTKPGEKTGLPAFRSRAGGVSAVVCHLSSGRAGAISSPSRGRLLYWFCSRSHMIEHVVFPRFVFRHPDDCSVIVVTTSG